MHFHFFYYIFIIIIFIDLILRFLSRVRMEISR